MNFNGCIGTKFMAIGKGRDKGDKKVQGKRYRVQGKRYKVRWHK
jgi:hypothetical protein